MESIPVGYVASTPITTVAVQLNNNLKIVNTPSSASGKFGRLTQQRALPRTSAGPAITGISATIIERPLSYQAKLHNLVQQLRLQTFNNLTDLFPLTGDAPAIISADYGLGDGKYRLECRFQLRGTRRGLLLCVQTSRSKPSRLYFRRRLCLSQKHELQWTHRRPGSSRKSWWRHVSD